MADLTVDRLAKSFPTPTEPLEILKDVSLELSAGESLAIVGPSGSGKSTLLQIIGTLDEPTEGHVTIEGQDPFELSEPDLAKFRSEKIGFVFQDHHLLPQLTALENVLVPTLANAARPEMSTRAKHLLDQVGLASRMEHRPAELSGGERQRVAIARALIHQPLLLLADEPTGNLDPKTADSVAELLLQLQADTSSPTLLIVVTHSYELARQLQQVRTIEAGELIATAATDSPS